MNIIDGMDAARFRSGNADYYKSKEKKQAEQKPDLVQKDVKKQK